MIYVLSLWFGRNMTQMQKHLFTGIGQIRFVHIWYWGVKWINFKRLLRKYLIFETYPWVMWQWKKVYNFNGVILFFQFNKFCPVNWILTYNRAANSLININIRYFILIILFSLLPYWAPTEWQALCCILTSTCKYHNNSWVSGIYCGWEIYVQRC